MERIREKLRYLINELEGFLLEEEKEKITYKNNKIQETNNEKDIIEAVTYLKDKFGKTIPHWGLINNSNN